MSDINLALSVIVMIKMAGVPSKCLSILIDGYQTVVTLNLTIKRLQNGKPHGIFRVMRKTHIG